MNTIIDNMKLNNYISLNKCRRYVTLNVSNIILHIVLYII